MSGLPEIYVLHGLKVLKCQRTSNAFCAGDVFLGGKIDDSEQMTEINILLKQIWQTNRGNLRITRLFWDHAFVAKKNLENPKRPRPFNRMCKGCVSNASFLVFVGFFYPIGDTTTISMVDWIVSWFYSIFHSNHGKFYLRSTSIQIEHVWAKLLERLKPLKRHLEIWL